jgi:hypothetical protein
VSDNDTNSSWKFRLFGCPFEVRSALSPAEAKAALRKQKVGWLDPKTGPRGWILGPFLCLQWSALAQQGPVVLAQIADDGFGSRIRGRAGPDLASLSILGVMTGVVIFSIYAFALQIGNFGPILFSSAVALLFVGAVLWLRLASREDADPLVRFIRRVLETSAAPTVQTVPLTLDRTPVPSARLNVNGDERGVAPSEHDIGEAILAMEPDGFLILEFAPGTFMQTALEYDRFVLEKSEGGRDHFYRAKGRLDRNEIIDAMINYLRGREGPKQVVWEKASI